MSQKLRALIVEDSEDDTLLLARELKRAGYDLFYERVETPDAMNKSLQEQEWDIVISDYVMPHFSGLDALHVLKEKDLDLPFIIVSGAIGEDIAVEAMRAGAHDYVLKGNLARLLPAVARELKEAESRRERERIEEDLARSEESFRNIVETATEGIWVIDEESKTAFANQRIADMLGCSVEDMVGMSLFEFMDDDQVAYADALVDRRKKGVLEQHDFKFRRKDGTELWTIVSTYPRFHEDGRYAGALGMITDITDRKRAEELIEKNAEELKDLIDTAAHELRHPATVFRGYAQTLMANWEELDRETIQDALSRIDEATKRLMRLVISLLDTSSIERGKLDLSLSEVDPAAPVRRAIEEFRSRGLDRELRVAYAGLDDEEMDAEKVKHVLGILIDNAAIYSGDESPIDVECEKVEEEIVYSVADLGPGIPDEDRERIFERFYQVEDVLHHSVPGIGLGLYIAKTIVELHGGWIEVEPRDGGGSVFSFGIPCRPVTEQSPTGSEAGSAR